MLALPKAQEPGREDPSYLVQALLGGHEIRRQGVGAGKAAFGIRARTVGSCIHPRYSPLFGLTLGRSALAFNPAAHRVGIAV
jgi:hypothetical protein